VPCAEQTLVSHPRGRIYEFRFCCNGRAWAASSANFDTRGRPAIADAVSPDGADRVASGLPPRAAQPSNRDCAPKFPAWGAERVRLARALCHFASDPAGHLRRRSKIVAPCDHAVEALHARPPMLGHFDLLALPEVRSCEPREPPPPPPPAQGGLHNESYKPSGSGRARRAGAACPSDLAAPLHALRAMVSEASTRANQHFATGTVHHLKPSIEAVN
jgi:hypothetical protein